MLTIKMTQSVEDRKVREKEFHNDTFEHHHRKKLAGFYAINSAIHDHYMHSLVKDCAGKTILEYGCGEGSLAFMLAQLEAHVTGIDISDYAIQQAIKKTAAENLRISFLVMDAENLEFSDHSFDLICGSAILHHLILDRALSEIRRVLKENGRAVFTEPMGHNPFVNLFRKLTPSMRTKDEHPLLVSDLRLIRKVFPESQFTFYYLTTMLSFITSILPFQREIVSFYNFLDRLLFRLIPFLRRYAWQVLIEIRN